MRISWSAFSFLLAFIFIARNAEGLQCLVCDDKMDYPDWRTCKDLDDALTMDLDLGNFTLEVSIKCDRCINGTVQKSDGSFSFRGCWTLNNTVLTTTEEEHQISMPDFTELLETGNGTMCTSTSSRGVATYCLKPCFSDNCNVPNPPKSSSTPLSSFPQIYIVTAGAAIIALIIICIIMFCICCLCSSRGQYNLADGVNGMNEI